MSILLHNKKAGFNYEILDTFDAGIALRGFEVKTLKAKRGSLDGAYITIDGDEAFLVNMDVPAFQPANAPSDYDSRRRRKLLLKKKEIETLIGKEKEKGLTVIPLKLYNTHNLVKVEIAVARGKKKYDKRASLKKKATERDLERSLKR